MHKGVSKILTCWHVGKLVVMLNEMNVSKHCHAEICNPSKIMNYDFSKSQQELRSPNLLSSAGSYSVN